HCTLCYSFCYVFSRSPHLRDLHSFPTRRSSDLHLPSTVGGGTIHWDAKTPRFWDIDFKKRSLLGPVEGADIQDWPFEYRDLAPRSEEHTSELQSRVDLVCRLLLEKKKNINIIIE